MQERNDEIKTKNYFQVKQEKDKNKERIESWFCVIYLQNINIICLFLQIQVKALYDYTASHQDELSFTKGAIITNVNKTDNGW